MIAAIRAHPDTTTKAGGHANRNAGFIRQAGAPHQGCRMNPAFRWWCQDAPQQFSAGFPTVQGRLSSLPVGGAF
jgi:hypothetical protein